MYLHLGQSVVVPFRDVLGVFDLDNTSSSHLTRAFLERAEKEGRVVNVSDDLPRSFVLWWSTCPTTCPGPLCCAPQPGVKEQSICLSCPPPPCCGGRRATVSNKKGTWVAGGGSCGIPAGAAPGCPDIPMEVFKCLKK